MKRLASLLICIATLLSLPAVAQSPANGGAATDNMRILREKMMGDKKLIVAANMALTDAESKAFWPIYDAYQAELQKINEQLGTIIADYARMHNAGKLTDARARALMDRYLGAEEAEVRGDAEDARQQPGWDQDGVEVEAVRRVDPHPEVGPERDRLRVGHVDEASELV